jgi:hypothetical protein
MEHVGNDTPVPPLDLIRALALTLKDRLESRKQTEWEHAAFPVLGSSRLQPNPSSIEIDLRPPKGKQFRVHPPSHQIRGFKNTAQVIGQLLQKRLQFGLLEESLTSVLDGDLRHGRTTQQFARSDCEVESLAENSEFILDG